MTQQLKKRIKRMRRIRYWKRRNTATKAAKKSASAAGVAK